MRAERIVSVPRVRRRSTTERLREAVEQIAGPEGRVLSHTEAPWASITFAGTRHRIELLFEGAAAIPAGEAFLDALPDHEFALPRQLVAEARITAVDHRLSPEPRMTVRAEILLLDEG
jgi:hypothetical protein